MREFYEACDEAMDSDSSACAVRHLTRAHTIMQTLIQRAKARLELRTVADLVEQMQWAESWVEYKTNSGTEWPGPTPWRITASGTTYVYPPTPARGRTSLDYRWGKRQDLPESYLPSVSGNQRRNPFPKG